MEQLKPTQSNCNVTLLPLSFNRDSVQCLSWNSGLANAVKERPREINHERQSNEDGHRRHDQQKTCSLEFFRDRSICKKDSQPVGFVLSFSTSTLAHGLIGRHHEVITCPFHPWQYTCNTHGKIHPLWICPVLKFLQFNKLTPAP